jgi:hypothetical protein
MPDPFVVNARLRELVAQMSKPGTARDNLNTVQSDQLGRQRRAASLRVAHGFVGVVRSPSLT